MDAGRDQTRQEFNCDLCFMHVIISRVALSASLEIYYTADIAINYLLINSYS